MQDEVYTSFDDFLIGCQAEEKFFLLQRTSLRNNTKVRKCASSDYEMSVSKYK